MTKAEMQDMVDGLSEMFKEYLKALSDEQLDSDPDAYESPKDRAERVFEGLLSWLEADYGNQ